MIYLILQIIMHNCMNKIIVTVRNEKYILNKIEKLENKNVIYKNKIVLYIIYIENSIL